MTEGANRRYHRLMSGAVPPEFASEIDESSSEDVDSAAPTAGAKSRFRFGGAKSQWAPLAGVVIAVVAAGLAIVALFQPLNHRRFSDQDTADAKKDVCAAYADVHQAVVTNTHLPNPNGNDPVGQLAVAANARLALLGGGGYLRERLAAEPASPADLTKAIDNLANTIEHLGINYLAGASAAVQDPLRQDVDSQISQIDEMCK